MHRSRVRNSKTTAQAELQGSADESLTVCGSIAQTVCARLAKKGELVPTLCSSNLGTLLGISGIVFWAEAVFHVSIPALTILESQLDAPALQLRTPSDSSNAIRVLRQICLALGLLEYVGGASAKFALPSSALLFGVASCALNLLMCVLCRLEKSLKNLSISSKRGHPTILLPQDSWNVAVGVATSSPNEDFFQDAQLHELCTKGDCCLQRSSIGFVVGLA